MKKIAILLSGCGYLDGAEIRESVLTLLALDTFKEKYDIFSLNYEQHHVVNHLSGEVSSEKRNTLDESARIARGNISDIAKIDVNNYSSLIIPGGFGVAKNFCSFAFDGVSANVNPIILNVIKAFHINKKPIGAICISPALIALSLGDCNPNITLGNDDNLAHEIEKTGVKHIKCKTSECVIDDKNKIVTTPAYMDDDINLSDAYLGISKLVKAVIELS